MSPPQQHGPITPEAVLSSQRVTDKYVEAMKAGNCTAPTPLYLASGLLALNKNASGAPCARRVPRRVGSALAVLPITCFMRLPEQASQTACQRCEMQGRCRWDPLMLC